MNSGTMDNWNIIGEFCKLGYKLWGHFLSISHFGPQLSLLSKPVSRSWNCMFHPQKSRITLMNQEGILRKKTLGLPSKLSTTLTENIAEKVGSRRHFSVIRPCYTAIHLRRSTVLGWRFITAAGWDHFTLFIEANPLMLRCLRMTGWRWSSL